MPDETVERWICPECGSTRIETDPEDGSMWHCMDCDARFPKYVVPEKFVYIEHEHSGEPEWDNGEQTEEDEDDFWTEGESEDWGI